MPKQKWHATHMFTSHWYGTIPVQMDRVVPFDHAYVYKQDGERIFISTRSLVKLGGSWMWGEELHDTHQLVEEAIVGHLMSSIDKLSTVVDPEGNVYDIEVLVNLRKRTS